MNTQELIESTMLHTLGLLEDHEIEEYEAAYAAAPESVQLLVREEAIRMSDFGDLMPSNEPDPALRELVVSAVRAAMREQENEVRIAGRIDHNTARQTTHMTEQRTERRAQPKLSTTPRVHRLWRASTIGFAAATIALSVVWTNNNQAYNQSPDALIGQLYDNIGAEFLESTLFDPTTQHVSMVSMENGSKAVVPDVKTYASQGELQDFEVQVNLKDDRRLAIYKGISDAIDESHPVMKTIDSNI